MTKTQGPVCTKGKSIRHTWIKSDAMNNWTKMTLDKDSPKIGEREINDMEMNSQLYTRALLCLISPKANLTYRNATMPTNLKGQFPTYLLQIQT